MVAARFNDNPVTIYIFAWFQRLRHQSPWPVILDFATAPARYFRFCMFAWYQSLDGNGRRAFWACFGGYALDAMDLQLFSFAVPVLIAALGISVTQAGILASATLAFSAIGGWGAGLLADSIGRVRTLQITIAWFSVFTFLSGLTTGFDQLLVMRCLQGLGFGGEWTAGSVLIGEVIVARHRGKAVGVMQAAWSVGWGAAAVISTGVFLSVDARLAWRLLFFAGLFPALLALAVRRMLHEYHHGEEETGRARLRGALTIFNRRYLGMTARGCFLALGVHSGYYAITIWLPTYLRLEKKLSVLSIGGHLAIVIAGSLVGCVTAAYLNDWWGRRPTFLLYAIGALAVVFAYTGLPVTTLVTLILGFPLGFFASGIYSGLGPLFTELFPTSIRGSGQGFCFNFGRGLASLFPALVGTMSARQGFGEAIGVFSSLAYGMVIVAALMLPETRGREVTALTDSANAA